MRQPDKSGSGRQSAAVVRTPAPSDLLLGRGYGSTRGRERESEYGREYREYMRKCGATEVREW